MDSRQRYMQKIRQDSEKSEAYRKKSRERTRQYRAICKEQPSSPQNNEESELAKKQNRDDCRERARRHRYMIKYLEENPDHVT